MKRIALLALAAASLCMSAHADPIKFLFVGDSDIVGRRGISVADAVTLQRVAAIQVGTVPEPETRALMLGGFGLTSRVARRRVTRH